MCRGRLEGSVPYWQRLGLSDHGDVELRHVRLDARQRGMLREVHVKGSFAGWVVEERV